MLGLLIQCFWAAAAMLVLNVLTASVQDQVNQKVEWEDDLVRRRAETVALSFERTGSPPPQT